jgi:hypothetical protein
VTWYLATDRAVVTLEIKGTSDNRGVTTVLRLRKYPLATLQWSEIEETHAPGEPVYKLTLHFAGGKVEINSLKVEAEQSDREAVREFAAQIMRPPQRRESTGGGG